MIALALAIGLAAGIAEGDAYYARRAEGATGDRAVRTEIDAALAAYREALAADGSSVEARWKLLRALYFRGDFCGASDEERRVLFEEARHLGGDGIATLEKGGKRGPEVAPLYFWTAVAWGEWALARGKLAAVRQGAAGHIRDLAQKVIELDPDLEQGGGYRILGRLHDQAPHILLLTGWVSKRAALDNLRKSLERGPTNTVTQFFLAEAILSHEPEHRDEAKHLLEACASASPRPDFLVEDAHYLALARARLEELKAHR
jgi:hypothetical protein